MEQASRELDILPAAPAGRAMDSDFLQGLRDGVPIGLGYVSVSFTFGMMAVSMGLPVWVAVLISISNLTSAGQFAGLTLMAAGGTYLEMALTQLVINIRYALMSLSLSQRLDGSATKPRRMLIAYSMTDEIFAVASSRAGQVSAFYMFGLILVPILGWTGGTLAGAAAGSVLPEAVGSALGIAIYGMFIAIIVPAAKNYRPVLLVTLLAVAMSCLFRFAPLLNRVSGGFVIILCAVAAAGLGAWLFPIREEEREEGSEG